MANGLKIKRGDGAPVAGSDGSNGVWPFELAYDYTNNKLYINDGQGGGNGNMQEVGGGTITSVTGMTNNNVLTASGSTTISGEGSLTFDGNELDVSGNVDATGVYKLDGTTIINTDGNFEVHDTRAVTPSTDLGVKGVRFDFKNNSADGLSDGGSYHGVMTLQQWNDTSGGHIHALGFTDNGNVHHRNASIGGTFGNWKRLAYIENGSNNRVMTASSSSTVNGEGNLTFDGTNLTVAHSSGAVIFAAAHAADKIQLYSGGNEKIGTEANTMLFTSDNYKFKDVAGTSNLSMDANGSITLNTVIAGAWNGTAIANDYVANLPTSKITSGTFADARIAASNVTQHGDGRYFRTDATSGTITSQDWNDYINATEVHFSSVTGHTGSNRPTGAYTYGVALSYSVASGGKFQLYAPEKATAGSSTNEGLWYRSGWNTTYRQWAQIWDSTNDGSGSGLDADLLDGSQGSHYLDAGNLTGTIDSDRIDFDSTDKIVRWNNGRGYHGNPRSMAIGYSGGNYGQFGYNIEFTTTSNTHNYAFNDIATRCDLYDGLMVYTSGSGGSGQISWTELLDCRNNVFTYKGSQIPTMANGSNNRVMTSNDAYSLNGEGNLIFDGNDLNVSANTDNHANIGRAKVGAMGHSDWAGFAHYDTGNTTKYALLQSSVGHTILNAASGQHISFRIENNTSDMMRISSAGNVGIGTTSPDSKLQVEYTTTSNGSAAIAEFGTSGSGAIANSGHQVIIGGPNVSGYTGAMIYSDSTSGVGIISFADGRGANDSWRGMIQYEHSNDAMTFSTNTSERMRINSSGNVGIGTASPAHKLEVRGDIAVAISDTQDIIKLSDAGNDGSIELYTGESTPVLRTKLAAYGDSYFSHSTSKVGIGTTSPEAKLDIVGNSDSVAALKLGSNATHGFHFFERSTEGDLRIKKEVSGSLADVMNIARSDGDVGFYNNVGIGTASPDTLLHIKNTGSGGTTTLKLEDNAREMYLGRDSIKVTALDGSTSAQLYINSNVTFSGSVTGITTLNASSSLTTGYGVAFTNGNTNFLQYNNSGENVLYLRDTTNGSMLQTWGVSTVTMNKNTSIQGNLNVSGNSFLQYGLVVNEGSHDADFRVESNSNAHMIQADAGNSRVGINNSSPYESLDAKSLSSTSPAIVANGAAANGCVNMAHGYAGANGDYVNTYGSQYSSIATVIGYGVKPSTNVMDQFLCSADNANFTRGALVIDNELRFWQGVAATGTLNNAMTMTERFRLNASGDGHFDGDVVAYSSTVSDKRLKENITTIDNALNKVMALRGVEYDWTATSRKGTHDIGLVAQEVEKVIPELVTEHELCTGEFGGEGNEKTFKTVNYDKMVGVLIEAIKEQQVQIDELKNKLGE